MFQGDPYTPAADVFSFGLVLWEVLTNEQPFAKLNPFAAIRLLVWETRILTHAHIHKYSHLTPVHPGGRRVQLWPGAASCTRTRTPHSHAPTRTHSHARTCAHAQTHSHSYLLMQTSARHMLSFDCFCIFQENGERPQIPPNSEPMYCALIRQCWDAAPAQVRARA